MLNGRLLAYQIIAEVEAHWRRGTVTSQIEQQIRQAPEEFIGAPYEPADVDLFVDAVNELIGHGLTDTEATQCAFGDGDWYPLAQAIVDGRWDDQSYLKRSWENASSLIYAVNNEDGENIESAKMRRLDQDTSRWLYVDEVDGWQIISQEQADDLLTNATLDHGANSHAIYLAAYADFDSKDHYEEKTLAIQSWLSEGDLDGSEVIDGLAIDWVLYDEVRE